MSHPAERILAFAKGNPAFKTALKCAGWGVGIALLGAAVWAAVFRGLSPSQPTGQAGQTDANQHAVEWAELLSAGSLPVFVLLVGIASLAPLLSSLTLWALTQRVGRVGKVEMLALTCAAWLLNYLPLWPGLAGRVAYHKKFNKITVRDSVLVAIWARGLSIVAAVVLGALAYVGAPAWLTVLAMVLGCAAALFMVKATSKRMLTGALLLRFVEIGAWSLRYVVCMALVGVPVSPEAALVMAAAAMTANCIPLLPNALGLREWGVGLAAGLAIGAGHDVPVAAVIAAAISAELINRAAEVAIAVPAGLWGAWWAKKAAQKHVESHFADNKPA